MSGHSLRKYILFIVFSTAAIVSPKESDRRELNARKECNLNEPIGVIKKILNSERTNVKNENGNLDGNEDRPKQDYQDPVISRNQKECSPERPLDNHPKGKGWQSYTNQHQERSTEMYKNVGDNQQSNQYQELNPLQNQYQGRSQGMHANQGYNQQPEQGFNQTPNQYPGRPQGMHADQGFTRPPNQYPGRIQGMYTDPGYNQQQHQFQGYNQQPNQYQGRPKGMCANRGYNQQPNQHQGYNQQPNQHQGYNQQPNQHQGYNPQRNQHQGYNQPKNQFDGYNQPHQPQLYSQDLEGLMPPPLLPAQHINPPQQSVTVFVLPIHVPSGSPSGQGLPPKPLMMSPYTPTISPQGNLNIIEHQDSPQRDQQTPDREKQLKKKKGKKDKNKPGENKKQNPQRSEQTKLSELLMSEEETQIKHQEDRERGRCHKKGRGGHGYNENKHEKTEDENVLENQKRRGNGRDMGRGKGGKRQLERTDEQEDGEINDVDDIDVFKFLIKSFDGGCTFEDFLRRCDLFPKGSNICSWFKKHSRRFHIFWDENDIVYI
ncbi:TPR-containing protein DDB_G0280363-like [Mytilus trossulus]|uniref:TPR-containing protein DDB_G0280363-like n=1 Tax=Mytilus trossulus TaxID=6551 RepID=UPI0030071EEB